jgi:hypothetical protein
LAFLRLVKNKAKELHNPLGLSARFVQSVCIPNGTTKKPKTKK